MIKALRISKRSIIDNSSMILNYFYIWFTIIFIIFIAMSAATINKQTWKNASIQSSYCYSYNCSDTQLIRLWISIIYIIDWYFIVIIIIVIENEHISSKSAKWWWIIWISWSKISIWRIWKWWTTSETAESSTSPWISGTKISF
jgi:hypothetical protein